MVYAGTLMILFGIYGTIAVMRNRVELKKHYLKWMIPGMALPFIANSAGWIMTEVGRQPWAVFGLQATKNGVSPTVSTGMVLTTLIGFSVIYGILAVVLVYLFVHFIKKGPDDETALHKEDDNHPVQIKML